MTYYEVLAPHSIFSRNTVIHGLFLREAKKNKLWFLFCRLTNNIIIGSINPVKNLQ